MKIIRPALLLLLFATCPAQIHPARASGTFPFGSELILDAAPMHGTKRMPILEIDDNGATSIDLWCTSVQAQATVGADGTITIVPGASAPAQCTPERESLDQDLITALAGATSWRRNGDLIELSGSATLRFRLMTN
jgi:heat shock protein HslJ